MRDISTRLQRSIANGRVFAIALTWLRTLNVRVLNTVTNNSSNTLFQNGLPFAKTFLTIIAIVIFNALGFQTNYSQTNLSMGNTAGGPAGTGPLISSQPVTLYEGGTIVYTPTITATYSFSNQQYAPVGSTPTPVNQLEGIPTISGVTFGGGGNGTANTPMVATNLFSLMNGISGPTNAMFTACNACAAGTGIDTTVNRSIGVFLGADALIDSANANRLPLNSRVYYGDMTITFNRPVSNPVLQFVGMGGQVSYGLGTAPNTKFYDLGFATEFDLVGTSVSFTKLSGNAVMNVTPTSITNTATRLGASSLGAAVNGVTRTAASGSVVAVGTNITSITVKVYLRGDGGIVVNSTGVVQTPDPGFSPRWSLAPGFPVAASTGLVTGDLMLFGVSIQRPVSLSGNVFNDVNGLSDSIVNGTGIGLPSGTQLYANLVDAAGNVVASVAIGAGGTYNFDGVGEGSYTMQVSTNQGTVGSVAPAIALPAGWVNTGENTGAAAGNDGTVNGSQAVTVTSANITNINFGIEQPPTPVSSSVGSQTNPGGTTNATVPATAFSATDPSSGTITSIRITAFPSNATSITINGTTYTSATFPVGGVTVPTNTSGNPTQTITVDPIDGTVTVGIPFKATDNAGKESSTTGTVSLPFTGPATFVISGNVFNDVNGLSDSTVNGTGTGLPSGTQLYVNLVNGSGNVVATVPVNADGTYSIPSISNGTYTTQVSVNQGTVGSPAPAVALPTGWVNTGENTGVAAGNDGTVNGIQSITVAGANITNINFGIEQPPTPTTNTNPVQANPGGTTNATVPATLFSSTDPTGGTIASIRITAFPSNATSITINGTTYTSATFPVGGVSVPTNASGNPTQVITVDPIDGTVTVAIPYKSTDNAGMESTTTANANMPFSLYSIGNRIWYDTNSNSRVDASEVGISGVSVSLFADADGDGIPDSGTALQTVTTDANGYYRFDDLTAGGYVVRINPSNFSGVLNGYKNTTGNVTGDVDSDLTTAGDNGINPTGAQNSVNTSGILSNSITLGPGGSEPTGETDVAGSGQGGADSFADMTVDFGFYEICLCGTIWSDTGTGGGINNNGIQDGGELGIPSLRVRVYDSLGNEIPVGDDGILGTADDALGGTLTDASGVYHFRGLLPGDYRIAVATGNSSTPTNNNPNDNVVNDDNGYNNPAAIGSIPAGWVVSHPITLTAGGEPLVNNADGSTANTSLGMGIIAAPSAVKMDKFDVYSDGNKAVITWATGSEMNNLGFNVYREVAGKRELLTKTPIAGSAFRSNELQASGESYQFVDRHPSKGAVYLVEDVDLNGDSVMHGGVSAEEKDLSRFGLEDSKSMADISVASDEARFERESVKLNAKSATKLKVGKLGKFDSKSAQAKQLEIAKLGGLKVEVNQDGWYRLSAQQLAVGRLSNDAANWQLYANGKEVPMRVNDDFSVDFYGQTVDSRTTNSQAYYIINGKTAGQRLETMVDSGDQSGALASSFTAVSERKERTVYAPYLLNGDKENWFGPSVYTNNQTVQTVNVSNLASGNTKLSVKLQGYTANQHSVRVSLNDTELGTVEFNGSENKSVDFNLPADLVQAGANQVKLMALNASDVSLVESVKLTYPKQYKAVNDQLRFTVAANSGVAVTDFSNEDFNVFELENGQAAREISPEITKENDKYGFILNAGNRDREFIAIGKNQANAVAKFEQNTTSNLASNENGTSFVIIAPKSLSAKAEQLAQMRRNQKIDTQVVEIEDVYDEFTFGLHDGQAIKNFLQFANSNWKVKPTYVLLFGDSSADSKGYLNGNSRDFVPTKFTDTSYMETASDSSLADFNGDDIEDIAIGRLPVATEAEADLMLAKLARFDAQARRSVLKNVLVADSEFGSFSDQIANQMPVGMTTVKLNRSNMTDADLRNQIAANANDNPIIVSYFGHGNTSNWTNAGVFNRTDALSLSNEKLSFYLLMTCLNGYTHSPYVDSLAESLMRSNGGAIAVLASPNLNTPDGQQELRLKLVQLMLTTKSARFGQVIRLAKSATLDLDVRKSYQLIGDPTVVVK
jgi:hypothetical protein